VARNTWVGDELISSRAIEHVARRQRWALAILATGAVAWFVYQHGVHGLFFGAVAAGALAGAAIETLIAVSQRERANRSADELIESGFRSRGRTDLVSLVVDQRIAELTSEQACRRLAELLRWYVELEVNGMGHIGARARTIAPLRGLGANAELVERIAGMMEQGSCDPRVPIRVHRLLTSPTGLSRAESNDEPEDSVSATLLGVERLLEAGTFSGERRDPDSPSLAP
jgi:hypothetical protein